MRQLLFVVTGPLFRKARGEVNQKSLFLVNALIHVRSAKQPIEIIIGKLTTGNCVNLCASMLRT